MPVDIVGFGYALAVAAGGIVGYVKSGKFKLHYALDECSNSWRITKNIR